GDRGGRGGPGGFDPARAREWMNTQIKEQMGANDDEWKVIEPKLTKVMDLRRDAGGFGRGGFRRRDDNSSSSSADDNQAGPVEKAQRELRQTLDNKEANAEQINSRLTALREAKEKAKTTLASAQKDLKEILTQRQEAVLVMFGMLD